MLEKVLKYLPYSNFFSRPVDEIIDKKFQIMSQTSLSREDRIQRLSTVNQFDYNPGFGADYTTGRYVDNYRNSIYSGLMENKPSRVKDYRELANAPKIKVALTEICDEFIAKDEKTGRILNLEVKKDDDIVNALRDELDEFEGLTFNFEKTGWESAHALLSEAELFWENIVSIQKPELGVLGLTRIDPARIDPVYFDVENELLDHFVLKKRISTSQMNNVPFSGNTGSDTITTNLILSKNQISYVHSGRWDHNKKFRLSHLEYVRLTHRKYQFVEDSAVIYMMTRAPERFDFKIPVGTNDPKKVEQIMQNQIQRLNTKRTLGWNGKIENTYDPQILTENFYFPAFGGGQPNASVTSINGGGQIPAIMEILANFKKDIYTDLNVPTMRLDASTGYSDGTDITREELRFAKFIMRVQQMVAEAVKRTFIIHLKLKNKKMHLFESVVKKHGEAFKDKDKFWKSFDQINEDYKICRKEFLEEHLQKLKNISQQITLIREEKREISQMILESSEKELRMFPLNCQEEELLQEALIIKNKVEDVKEKSQSIWEKYDLTEDDIKINFNPPTAFFALKAQQFFQIKVDNLNNLGQNPLISFSYMMKKIMGWTDDELRANMEWLKKDSALQWLIANIQSGGPNFRQAGGGQGEGGGEMGGMGGGPPGGPGLPDMGGGGGGPTPDDTKLADLKEPNVGGGNASAEGGGPADNPSGGNSASTNNPAPPP